MIATASQSLQLTEMSECACRLGMAFGAVAEREDDDPARQLQYFDLFERCFFAVRMATSLTLRLGHSLMASSERERPERERPEQERPEQERAERQPSDRDIDRDRERERDRESASFPMLLKTLGAVADAASALPGPAPAALPSLRELLAQFTSDPAPAKQPTEAGQGLRARLAGSAATPVVTLPSSARPSPIPALHRATGPPRR